MPELLTRCSKGKSRGNKMSKSIAIFITHGMGDLTKREFEKRVSKLSRLLRLKIGSEFSKVIIKPIYFQDILQNNQYDTFRQIKKYSEIDWIKLRKFMLYSFSDAVSLEHHPQDDKSVYCETQRRILNALLGTYPQLDEDSKVLIVSHSLGCQVISNYIWDAQSKKPSQGVWTKKLDLTLEEEKFCRLKNLKYLYTTGCNIAIFIAGQKYKQAIRTSGRGYDFKWHNFYDEDDVLGWPLKPLGKFYNPDINVEGTSYYQAITKDHLINANSSTLGMLLKSWNPFSHGEYWGDKEFIRHLSKSIRKLIN